MECGSCNIRSSVGYCHECELLLCEECSHTCERCHKTVCRSHIQRTSSGRRICVSCVVHHYDQRAKKAKERREMRAEAAATGERVHHGGHKKKHRSKQATAPVPEAEVGETADAPAENLSFEALRMEQGGISAGPAIVDEEPRPMSPLVDETALNERVLTGSASQRRPKWLRGLVMAVLAWLLFIGAFTGSELGMQQHIFNGTAVLFALASVMLVGGSAFAKDVEASHKKRCRYALALGGLALVVSGLVLYMRLTLQ